VLGEIEAKGATVLGISVDSGFAHAAFRDKLNLTMPLLADFKPKGEVSRAYGAFIERADTSNRSLVLIDEEGKVEWSYESPSPIEIPGANLIYDALEG
jgi:peroxiredoxin